MTRKIMSVEAKLVYIPPPQPGQDVRAWLEAQVGDAAGTFYLLAHADDGVIWGRVENGALVTAHDIHNIHHIRFGPPLRMETLQSARLFSDAGEVFLWRDGDGNFHARAIIDGEGKPVEYFDEDHILWGSRVKQAKDGFSLMSDGAQGLQHAVPIAVRSVDRDRRPLRLTVRHYLGEDAFGLVRVACSRLVTLYVK